MDALKSVLGPLGGSGLVDTMKLVVLGGTVETARRVSSSAWTSFVNSFFLTAHFSEEDYPFDWLMLWLSKRPEWQRSREFETTTRTHTIGLNRHTPLPGEIYDPDDPEYLQSMDEEAEGELTPGKQTMRVVFQPTFDTTHTIYYKGHWLRVRRSKKTDGSDTELLSISVVARSNAILKQLVLQAKKEYEADAVHRIQIYFADSHGSWRWTDSRHKRPLSSIVLDPGVKEMLLEDTRDFLRSEKWYADRGIPFRRGYLLHGVPGSGKSSLIHAIAGELALDIYVVSLSSSWINDSTLNTLMGRVPARCILLLEDLDAAFTRSTSRDTTSNGLPKSSSSSGNHTGGSGSGGGSGSADAVVATVPNNPANANGGKDGENGNAEVNTLSLSGLLNSLDGVAAAEGRILFATTNHLERLDPALSRPGRMDVWVEFKNASKWQCEQLFRNFFPSSASSSSTDTPLSPATSSASGSVSGSTSGSTSRSAPREMEISQQELDAFDIPGLTCEPLGSEPSSSSSSTTTSSSSPSAPSSSSKGKEKEPPASAPAPAPAPAPSLGGPSPSPPSSSSSSSTSSAPPSGSPPFPPPINTMKPRKSVLLDSPTLARLAKQFADAIPEGEFSVAALQGYLLKNKTRPEAAANEAAAWVISERELRERLKREKEEKERKERLEKERRRRELLEREREEQERRDRRVREEEEDRQRERRRSEERRKDEEQQQQQRKVAAEREERERAERKAKEEEAAAAVAAAAATAARAQAQAQAAAAAVAAVVQKEKEKEKESESMMMNEESGSNSSKESWVVTGGGDAEGQGQGQQAVTPQTESSGESGDSSGGESSEESEGDKENAGTAVVRQA